MYTYLLLIFLLFPFSLYSQSNKDSTTIVDSASVNSKKPFVMTKSPTGAIVRSLAFPGWGQWYVERYWKAPLFIGATAFTITNVVVSHNRYTTKQQEFDNSTNTLQKSVLLQQKENYRNQRDLFTFFTVLIYGIGAIDAYTDAHLFDFTVENLSYGKITPYTGTNGQVGLTMILEF